ncbi:MAG: redox-regulated ATPase YchF [Candidatus Dasytiphilus stammeri]
MILKCGVIGLPNVGKSTLFKSLTQSCIKISNYPFSTIKPHLGRVSVPDHRLNRLSKLINPQYITPAIMTFIDIAGLVKGASQGKGLGNKFLHHIRETTALLHVVRCFNNENIIHVRGRVNPQEDIDLINTELALSDLEICESAIERQQKIHNKSMDNKKLVIKVLKKIAHFLEEGKLIRMLRISEEEKSVVQKFNFLTLKPVIYVANVNEGFLENNAYVQEVYKRAKKERTKAITICAVEYFEPSISKKNSEKLGQLNFPQSELNNLITAGYNLLDLITYFTISSKEVRAWTVNSGATAYQVARKIHTDFYKRFIRAQIIRWEDFISYQGEQGAKLAGKIRLEGKQYVVQDGDIIHFLSP